MYLRQSPTYTPFWGESVKKTRPGESLGQLEALATRQNSNWWKTGQSLRLLSADKPSASSSSTMGLAGGEKWVRTMEQENQSDYSRAVLAIKTPVSVTLARKLVPLERIVNLVPGSMLTFDAHCDEPLTLEVCGQTIATGETVKIGDKFGLRIREILHDHSDES
jgi:flagellar motor switch protein FliN/FliY